MNNPNSVAINDRAGYSLENSRVCKSCKKRFHLNELKGNYHSKYQEYLKKVWTDSKMDFYCTGCFFLNLIKMLKKVSKSKK